MDKRAQVVIIGGGIVGCSTAYHLAKSGWKDVILVEKGELTSGSTWHAAGLVGQLRSSRNVTQMLKYSVELYRELEADPELSAGWREVGGLRLASSKERMYELKRAATMAKSFGLDMQLLTPQEAYDLFPIMSLEGVEGGAFLPTDGYVDPSSLTLAMATRARGLGVTMMRNTRVKELVVVGKRVTQVVTDQGTIEAEIVVNCAGMWAKDLGKMAGVNVPLIPMQHQFIVTEKIPDLPKGLPTMRDPDNLVYYKEEVGALVMGGYEDNPIPWKYNGIPDDFGQQLLPPDFDHFAPLSELAIKRTPLLEEAGVRKLINGPEAFTPDGHFIMGLAPELDNFFVAAGFNAHGIAAGGGVGRMMAEWIIEGQPSLDLWEVDIRRFGPHHQSLQWVKERSLELYAKHYTMSWPHEEHSVGRNIRVSPLFQRLREQGAVFGQKYGWERPNWFAPEGVEPKDQLTWETPNWVQYVAQEHKATRERVVLIDQSSFSKLEVTGPGAFDFLQYLSDNNLRKPPGSLTYTQFCNERGGIECDLTIARLAKDHFYITTGTAFALHDITWLRRHMPTDGSVQVTDCTSSRAVINVCGPDARRLLQEVCDADLSHEAFPFAKCQTIQIGAAQVLALRVTYVGELGWELHFPTEFAVHVYDLLWEAGQKFGIANAGYRAIESLRLEKGYRYWSGDLTPDYNPFEAGLDFCVRLKKPDFLGKEALLKVKEDGPRRLLCCFTLDEHIELYRGETISRDGKVLGVLTSGGYGHTIQKTIVYGYVPAEEAHHEEYELESLGKSYKIRRHDGALYDPERLKILS